MTALIEQIETAYRRDWAGDVAPPVSGRDQIPIAYEAITNAWLTDILCRDVPGAAVTDHDIGVPDDGSTNRRRIKLHYNDAGAEARLPTRLFCKATHDLANRLLLGHSGGAATEVAFYRDIRPRLDIECPRSFHARIDPVSFNSIIVLDDISDTVIAFCDHNTDVTAERARSQMRLLARLHGAGYGNQAVRSKLDLFPSWPRFFRNVESFGLEAGAKAGFTDARHVIPPRLFVRADEVWPATLTSVDLHDDLPGTLTHGDVHLKNWYIAGDGSMGLADWQCASIGHWSRDVAYAIATSLDVDQRRAMERDLLAFYISELARSGGPVVEFGEAWLQYRQQLVSALSWWTITLHPAPGMPAMQPHDVSVEFVRRIATAMDDVGSLDSFSA